MWNSPRSDRDYKSRPLSIRRESTRVHATFPPVALWVCRRWVLFVNSCRKVKHWLVPGTDRFLTTVFGHFYTSRCLPPTLLSCLAHGAQFTDFLGVRVHPLKKNHTHQTWRTLSFVAFHFSSPSSPKHFPRDPDKNDETCLHRSRKGNLKSTWSALGLLVWYRLQKVDYNF